MHFNVCFFLFVCFLRNKSLIHTIVVNGIQIQSHKTSVFCFVFSSKVFFPSSLKYLKSKYCVEWSTLSSFYFYSLSFYSKRDHFWFLYARLLFVLFFLHPDMNLLVKAKVPTSLDPVVSCTTEARCLMEPLWFIYPSAIRSNMSL